MNILSLLFCGFMFGVVIFTIGHAGMEAAIEEQNLYCEMVADGTWPDYKGNAEEVCK